MYPSLGSMTLGSDDVDLAKRLLGSKKTWTDTNSISEYEKQFSEWNGSTHVFSFMSGRVALSACLYALDLQEGDEIILPGYTCVVVFNSIKFAKLKPVFVDIELDTYGIDSTKIEQKITSKTKAIILHHLYGLVCKDYEAILAIAKKNNLKVIEDCAHSTGAEFNGVKVGNFGDMAFYSSEQSKVFNTIQGGIAVTNSPEFAKKIKNYYRNCKFPSEKVISKLLKNIILNYYKYSNPGRWWKGDIANLFFWKQVIISTSKEEENGTMPENYGQRMPAPVAKIGINQLSKIEKFNNQRRKTAIKWDKWCDKKKLKKPVVIKNSKPVYLRFPIMVEEKNKQNRSWARDELGVLLGVWFVSNLHPVQHAVEDCCNADDAAKRCINLPCLGVCDV